MSLLEHNQLAIFSFPRAATKLISTVLEHAGYHNYGEWYDVWSSQNQGNTTVRLQPAQIQARLDLLAQHTRPMDLHMLGETAARFIKPGQKSVITVWYENAISFPLLFMGLADHHWVCPVRDQWEQMTSFMVCWHNNNFNAQWEHKPVMVDEKWFETFYWRWHHVRTMQEWLVSTGRGTIVSFDQVISGHCSHLGKYNVSSLDELVCPERLILNLNAIQSRFEQLEAQRINFGQVTIDKINKSV